MTSKQKKLEEKRREEVVKELPSFINQLLLLMSSGMVLPEAVSVIAVKYGRLDEKRKNSFTSAVYELYQSSVQSGENFLTAFCNFGRVSRIKELSKVAGIIDDGRERGNAIWDKLAAEGSEMWKIRKNMAIEKIRVSESKMSFPLGLLLAALIIITAAPAMLQMYIN